MLIVLVVSISSFGRFEVVESEFGVGTRESLLKEHFWTSLLLNSAPALSLLVSNSSMAPIVLVVLGVSN